MTCGCDFYRFLFLQYRESSRTKASYGRGRTIRLDVCYQQRGSNVGSGWEGSLLGGGGVRKRRHEACALGFLSEGLIVVCQRGQGSFSWLSPSLFYWRSPFFLLSPQVLPQAATTSSRGCFVLPVPRPSEVEVRAERVGEMGGRGGLQKEG